MAMVFDSLRQEMMERSTNFNNGVDCVPRGKGKAENVKIGADTQTQGKHANRHLRMKTSFVAAVIVSGG